MEQNATRAKKEKQFQNVNESIKGFSFGKYLINRKKDQTSVSGHLQELLKPQEKCSTKEKNETKKEEEEEEEEEEYIYIYIYATPIIAPTPIEGFQMEDVHYTNDDHIEHLLFHRENDYDYIVNMYVEGRYDWLKVILKDPGKAREIYNNKRI